MLDHRLMEYGTDPILGNELLQSCAQPGFQHVLHLNAVCAAQLAADHDVHTVSPFVRGFRAESLQKKPGRKGGHFKDILHIQEPLVNVRTEQSFHKKQHGFFTSMKWDFAFHAAKNVVY